ncbi:MAG: hypothetical protein AAFX87_07685 [Bacteroidota bacterium]
MDTNTSFNTAEQLLSEAKEQMMKPAEDVVPYSVCHKSFYAISHYLKGFLQQKGVSCDENTDMEKLVELATSEESAFSVLDNPCLKYPKETGDVWMNIDRATDFIELAEKTRSTIGLK